MKTLPLCLGLLLTGFFLETVSAQQKVTPIPSGKKEPAQAAPAAPDVSKKKETPPAAAAKPEPKPAPAPAGPQEYVVQKGDNPWVIAKNHGIELPALLRANKIKDPKNLKIGDILLLPEGIASKNAPKVDEKTLAPAKPVIAKPVPKEPESGDGWELYTIKSGDNPWTVAKQLKVDHQKIIKLNEGTDFTKLAIGQKIKVPKKS